MLDLIGVFMTEKDALNEEIKIYEKKKNELLKEHEGEFVLIKDSKIIGIFKSSDDAIREGIKKFGNVPFLVKKIERIEQSQNFTSNLIRCDIKCHQ